MDKYRSHKTSRRRLTSLDGFVSASPQGHHKKKLAAKKATSQSVRRPHTYQKTTDRPAIGNFRQTDGFHSFAQGVVGFGKPKSSALTTQVAGGEEAMVGRQPLRDGQGRIKVGKASKLAKPAEHKKRNWKKIVKRTSLSLLVLIVVGVGYFGIKTYMQSRKILAGGGNAAALQENVDPSLLKGEGDGRINILMLGKGGDGHTAPDLTDTILVASIDPANHEAAIVSIPRDTYVKTPSSGSMKINAVYATAKNKVLTGKKVDDQKKKAEEAGFNAIEDMTEEILGIPIHYHAMVDFEGFKDAVDAVGGVELDVTSPVYEVMYLDGRNYTLNVKVGHEKFDGFRALAYSRSRHTSTRGDFDRAERQRAILVTLKSKAFSLGTLSNPIKVNDLLSALGNHVQTNFSLDEIMRLREIGEQIDGSKVQSIGLADPPNNFLITGNVGNQSVVLPRAGLNQYTDIQSYIRNQLRDGYLKKEDAKVLILNGTSTTGLAAKTSEQLKSYGYNVIGIQDAPTKNYTNNIVVNLRGADKRYTAHYLEKRFNVSITDKIPDSKIDPGTADFVIIVGTNEKTRLGN